MARRVLNLSLSTRRPFCRLSEILLHFDPLVFLKLCMVLARELEIEGTLSEMFLIAVLRP